MSRSHSIHCPAYLSPAMEQQGCVAGLCVCKNVLNAKKPFDKPIFRYITYPYDIIPDNDGLPLCTFNREPPLVVTQKLTLNIDAKIVEYLDILLKTSLYGCTLEQVAACLINEKLRELIRGGLYYKFCGKIGEN